MGRINSSIKFQDTGYFSNIINDFLDQKASVRSFYHNFPTIEGFRNQIEEKQKAFSSQHREVLYARINARVDEMMTNGLLDEAKALFDYRSLNALQTVGYRELFQFLNHEMDLESAVALIKTNTRRFAKRQMTWFKKDPSIQWFDYRTPHAELIQTQLKQM